MKQKAAIAAAICTALLSSQADAAFTLTLTGLGSMTAPQQAAFNSAKATWEGIIKGYKPGVSLTGLTISASIVAIDGVGGILGSAGPSFIATQAGTVYTTSGQMQFDSADVANLISAGSFNDVILHEMGHVIGVGTLWTNNGLYVNGTGQYTGANALARFRTEFNQPAATSIPVELGGGSGTANGHWDEVNGGGSNTGLVSVLNGRDFRFELMTGWLNAPAFISETTKFQFVDLGYTIPEPTTLLGTLAGLTLMTLRRRA
jgi:hypothetical protein